MWTHSYSKTFLKLDRSEAWQASIDIDQWPKWHSDLEDCKLEGAFAVGSHFRLKPKGMRAVKIELIAIDEGFSFTDCTWFPGAQMCDTHSFEETEEGLKMTNTLVVTGILSFLWVKLVAKSVAQSVPDEMDALAAYVKEKHEKI